MWAELFRILVLNIFEERNRHPGNSLHRAAGPNKVPSAVLLDRGGGSAGGTLATVTGLGFAGFFLALGQLVFGIGFPKNQCFIPASGWRIALSSSPLPLAAQSPILPCGGLPHAVSNGEWLLRGGIHDRGRK